MRETMGWAEAYHGSRPMNRSRTMSGGGPRPTLRLGRNLALPRRTHSQRRRLVNSWTDLRIDSQWAIKSA
jgi:hypothetical protein